MAAASSAFRASSSDGWRLLASASALLTLGPAWSSSSSPSSCSSSPPSSSSSEHHFPTASSGTFAPKNPQNFPMAKSGQYRPTARFGPVGTGTFSRFGKRVGRVFFKQASFPIRCDGPAPRVCVIGDVFVDIMAKVPTLPQWDADTEADYVKVLPGGSALNQARHLHGLDLPVDFIGSLGTDSFGKMLRRHCEEQGFSTKWIKDFDLPSSVCMVLVGSADRAFVSCYSTTNAFSTDTVKEASSVLADASHVHFGGYFNCEGLHNPEFTEIVRSLKARGVTFSINTQYDAGEAWLGKEKHLLTLLPLTDYLVVNEIEAKKIAQAAFGSANPDAIVNAFPNVTLVMTRGSAGVDVIRCKTEVLHVASKRLKEVVDATGAGDAFLAGFLSVILTPGPATPSLTVDAKLRAACERGHRVAAVCVMREGACVEPVRTKDIE